MDDDGFGPEETEALRRRIKVLEFKALTRLAMNRSPEFCLKAVEQTEKVLPYVPKHFWKDIEFCRKAARLRNEALAYVPDEFRDEVETL
jgi:hypothetical protein